MADQITAETRTQFGKGAARKLRAAGKIPAVLYGHGTDPQHVSLPGHELSLIVRRANAVLELSIDGKPQLALVKDVQRDPVRQIIEHVDLLVVRSGERVHVEVPVHVEGEPAPSTMVALDSATVMLDVEATHIPERVTVDVEDKPEGTHITAADLELPRGAKLLSDPELLVVAITGIQAAGGAEEEAAPAVEGAAEAEETEPAADND